MDVFVEVNVDKSSIHGAYGIYNVFLVEILITGNISILVFFFYGEKRYNPINGVL